jgi:hypothetical protein
MSSLGMSAAGLSPWSARDGWCLWPCLVPYSHHHKLAAAELPPPGGMR